MTHFAAAFLITACGTPSNIFKFLKTPPVVIIAMTCSVVNEPTTREILRCVKCTCPDANEIKEGRSFHC